MTDEQDQPERPRFEPEIIPPDHDGRQSDWQNTPWRNGPFGYTRATQRVKGEATYDAQLRAFVAAVREGGPVLTGADDAIVTMRVIDDIYRAASLPIRGA